MRFWFRDWSLDGDGVVSHLERAWGPILFTQYAVAGGVLKMTVQLAPMEGNEPVAQLMFKGRAVRAVRRSIRFRDRGFRIDKWDSANEVPFEIAFKGQIYAGRFVVIRRTGTKS